MPEYDAFGNPVDQAPLESSPTPASEVTPSDRPVQPAPPAPAPTPTQPPRAPTPTPNYTAPPQFRVSGSGGSGRGLRILFIVLLSVALPLGITYYAFNKADDTFNSVQKSFESFSTPTVFAPAPPTPDVAGDTTPPAGLDRGSLLLAANFRPALREVRRLADGASPTFVRVEADRIDVQVARNGKTKLIHRPWNTKAEVIGGTSPGASNQPTFRWSMVDDRVPRRLYEAVRNGSTRPSKQIEYAVLSAGFDRWSAFRQNGTGFTADLHGRNVQRIGG